MQWFYNSRVVGRVTPQSGRDFLETEISRIEPMNQSEVTPRVGLIPSPWGEGEGEGDRDMHKQEVHPIRGCNRGRLMRRTAALQDLRSFRVVHTARQRPWSAAVLCRFIHRERRLRHSSPLGTGKIPAAFLPSVRKVFGR